MDMFRKEMKEIARVIQGIARHSEENDPSLDKQMAKLETLFISFHRKYPKLELKFDRKIDEVMIRLLIHEDAVRKVFDNAAKIKGLAALGASGFDEASIKDAAAFAAVVNQVQTEAYITYASEHGTETIVLQWNLKEGKVELNYEIKNLLDSYSAEVQLLSMYAETQHHTLDLLNQCYELGFTDIEDDALHSWEDEFYPKMWE